MLHFKEGDCLGLGMRMNVATLEGRSMKEYCFRRESTLLHFKEGDRRGPWERINVATFAGRGTVIGESLR